MKFLFLATALFALYGSVVCDLPAELYGLGFVVQADAAGKAFTLITFADGTQYRTGRTGTGAATTITMVDTTDSSTELTPETTTSKMGKKSTTNDLLVKTYDLNSVKVTVDLTVPGCTTLTTAAGNSVSIDVTTSDPDVLYTNNKNKFVLKQSGTTGSYTYTYDDAGTALAVAFDVAANTITAGVVGSGTEKVFDLNGDDPNAVVPDPCVAPTTTCIDDPCTSSYGWNQWCVPSYGYKYGFRTGGCYRRRSCFRRRSRCYSFPSYYC